MTFNKFYALIHEENSKTDFTFANQFKGAFLLIFDIDREDFIDRESSENSSIGKELGISSLGVGDYWYCPEKARSSTMNKFFIKYKNRRYEIFCRVTSWYNKPTSEDMLKSDKGIDISYSNSKKVPIDLRSYMSATGHITEDDYFYDSNLGKMDREQITLSPSIDYGLGNHFVFTSLRELAVRVKSIIDDRDRKRTNVNPKNTPTKNPTDSPKLVNV